MEQSQSNMAAAAAAAAAGRRRLLAAGLNFEDKPAGERLTAWLGTFGRRGQAAHCCSQS
jgi:hypothetical protein